MRTPPSSPAQTSYQLSESDYIDAPPDETWVGRLAGAFDGALTPLGPRLTKANAEALFALPHPLPAS